METRSRRQGFFPNQLFEQLGAGGGVAEGDQPFHRQPRGKTGDLPRGKEGVVFLKVEDQKVSSPKQSLLWRCTREAKGSISTRKEWEAPSDAQMGQGGKD